jgi:Flp pilus assembly protein TadD
MSDMLHEAARLAQGPDPAAARPLVARLLAADGNDADALTIAGIVAQRTGDAAAALDHFARARATDPDNPARIGNHATALKQAGRFDEAIAAFQHALALRPGAAVTLANLGSCLIAAERAGEAEAPLRAAIAAKPGHAEAWNNLGIALARTGRGDAADAAYLQALALRPGYAEAALNRVDLLDRLGRTSEAEALAEKMLRSMPGHPRASNQLAAIRERQGDLPGAIALYRDALDRGGLNHPIGINLAMTLLRSGYAAGANELCDRLLADLPSVTTPLALKCSALERLGDRAALSELMALERFVRVIDVTGVPGFADLDTFHVALEAELAAHPSLTFEPEGLVTRAGRQSGELAEADTRAIAALAKLAREALTDHHAALSGDDHPWLAARPDRWSLTLWGTILTPGGAVEPHIHAPNWLSGVYYPRFPAAMSEAREGWFAIGALPERLGGCGTLDLREPRPGRMILFPSYLWHATLPFGGTEDRISFAFDLVPEGIGRPHRLRP